MYLVHINSTSYHIKALNVREAKLLAARRYVREHPKANLDSRKVLNQYKIKVAKI